jgi:hypothetical protein
MGKAHNKTKPRPVFEPVRIDPAAAPAEAERIPLFYIGEVEYSIPAEMDARTGLVAIRLVRERGLEAAAAYMMEESIGRDALGALIGLRGCHQRADSRDHGERAADVHG